MNSFKEKCLNRLVTDSFIDDEDYNTNNNSECIFLNSDNSKCNHTVTTNGKWCSKHVKLILKDYLNYKKICNKAENEKCSSDLSDIDFLSLKELSNQINETKEKYLKLKNCKNLRNDFMMKYVHPDFRDSQHQYVLNRIISASDECNSRLVKLYVASSKLTNLSNVKNNVKNTSKCIFLLNDNSLCLNTVNNHNIWCDKHYLIVKEDYKTYKNSCENLKTIRFDDNIENFNDIKSTNKYKQLLGLEKIINNFNNSYINPIYRDDSIGVTIKDLIKKYKNNLKEFEEDNLKKEIKKNETQLQNTSIAEEKMLIKQEIDLIVNEFMNIVFLIQSNEKMDFLHRLEILLVFIFSKLRKEKLFSDELDEHGFFIQYKYGSPKYLIFYDALKKDSKSTFFTFYKDLRNGKIINSHDFKNKYAKCLYSSCNIDLREFITRKVKIHQHLKLCFKICEKINQTNDKIYSIIFDFFKLITSTKPWIDFFDLDYIKGAIKKKDIDLLSELNSSQKIDNFSKDITSTIILFLDDCILDDKYEKGMILLNIINKHFEKYENIYDLTHIKSFLVNNNLNILKLFMINVASDYNRFAACEKRYNFLINISFANRFVNQLKKEIDLMLSTK